MCTSDVFERRPLYGTHLAAERCCWVAVAVTNSTEWTVVARGGHDVGNCYARGQASVTRPLSEVDSVQTEHQDCPVHHCQIHDISRATDLLYLPLPPHLARELEMAEVQPGVVQAMQECPPRGDDPILILSLFIQVIQAQAR